MSDPFEAMRIPREQDATGGQPSAPPPGRPGPQPGYPQQQGYQQQPPGYRPPPPAAPQGQQPPGRPSARQHAQPADEFEQMRIRPENAQAPGPSQPAQGPSQPAQGPSQPAQGPVKNPLADVPHLRSYSGSASLGVRLLARAIDFGVVALIAVGLWFLLAYLLDGKLVFDFGVSGYLAAALVFVGLNLLYEVGVTLFAVTTLGRTAFNLRVVQYNTGEVMDTVISLRRQLLPTAALLVPYLGALLAPLTYLSALWDPTRLKRDWNDRITETTWVRRT